MAQHCTEKGHNDVVQVLINECGVSPNTRDGKRRTALHWAVANGQLDIIRTLLEHNATIDIEDHKGNTALQEAVNNGHVEVFLDLVKAGACTDNVYLHEAAEAGYKPIIQLLLEGYNVAAVDKKNNGLTALHKAVCSDKTNVAQLLLNAGTDINAPDQHGNTPLHWAATFPHMNVVRTLVSHGATIDLQNDKRETALSIAIEELCDERQAIRYQKLKNLSELLVEHGAELTSEIKNLEYLQNNPEFLATLERLSRKRLDIVGNDWCSYLRDQANLPNDIINGCVLRLALPQLQLNELAEIRQANTNWETHKDLYESIE